MSLLPGGKVNLSPSPHRFRLAHPCQPPAPLDSFLLYTHSMYVDGKFTAASRIRQIGRPRSGRRQLGPI